MTLGKTVIDGRFELRDRLGSGGMGAVWRAFDLALEREVALKEVRLADVDMSQLDAGTAQMMRERVMREARALARIDHPNVVTIHHIVDSPEMTHPWLVMELVRGMSLQERLAAGPMSPAEGAALGRGVLAALRAAHEAGICHRDVKPANVLLRTDGTPVLTDFGIAVLEETSRVTATGGLVGSPEYIAPERLHGEEGNPASDFWSLGMLLYVAVEGTHPLRRPTTAATLAAVMTAQIPPAQRAGGLTHVLQALLIREPDARPSAVQLDAMLASVSGGLPTSVPLPSPPPFSMPGPAQGFPPGPTHQPGQGVRTGPAVGPHVTHPAQQRPRRSKAVGAALALLVVGLVATVITVIATVALELMESDTPPDVDAVGTSRSKVPVTGSGGGKRTAAKPKTLLEPSTIRSVIKKFQEASGSRQFAEMALYPDHASADAPAKARPDKFDNFTYQRGADAAVRTRPSVAITENTRFDFSRFKWEALPQLMKRAEQTLNVKKPTNRYILAKSSWTFAGDKPVMMIYLGDEYGSGYMAVNALGKVVSTYPAD
ncbi:serine/threonine-protein kinase [Actinomadura hibisca]|uniref:serine/threonine-protein kinase n=1 Tax=Actinomadura hibisca TaxID=68565 RepID=UPI000AFA424D|nr:serine/threonine-protein kinase [Actinomadura hibisca]